ncbi:MAG: ACP S-malonyltransferase [Alphaproteobacteria bacterium]|nr:ACP S-malonyltransferase [Alphaproteobacteria bacterium]
MSKIFMFPGQGSQAVGMGLALKQQSKIASALFDEIDDALNQKLSAIMFEGTAETLGISENTQPALMAHSMAVIRVIEHEFGVPIENLASGLVGHSLGEYSALTAADVFDVATTAKLLRLRGQAMQQAVPQGVGSMAAIIGLGADMVTKITEQATESDDEVCTLANDNSAEQVVISGHKQAVERAMALCKEAGAKRVLPLPVSVPSHCKLMQPAAEQMAQAFADARFSAGKLPVYANISTESSDDSAVIQDALIQQLCGRVRFRETIEKLSASHQEFVEIGTGKVLCGLVKRIAGDSTQVSLGADMAQIETFIKANQ